MNVLLTSDALFAREFDCNACSEIRDEIYLYLLNGEKIQLRVKNVCVFIFLINRILIWGVVFIERLLLLQKWREVLR